jgi:tetratricopeptide (TPR) repeat protein
MTHPFFRLAFVAALVLGLAACQSAEERAEEHYQSALSLLEEGDLERAKVEFRNVFELNGAHVEARRAYAQAVREAGELQDAFGQFLRLVEQRPDDLEGHVALAQMAIETQQWEQLRRHGSRAIELAPEDPRIPPIEATLAYADAIENEDEAARSAAAEAAATALGNDPENLGLHRIQIDAALRGGDQSLALERVDTALGIAPHDRDLHNLRLTLLAQREDAEGVEAQLTDMVARFPEDQSLTATLLRFHIARGEVDAAEAFLRERIAGASAEDTELRVALVQFLLEHDGADAALDELDEMIAENPDRTVYRVLRASIRFDVGEQEEAIETLQALIDAGEMPQADLNEARITLAQMLAASGNPVGGRRLVGEVLESDRNNVAALKLEANWLIEDDQPDAAIARLRTALDEAPEDVDAMILMARAYQRNGNRELMRDYLSLAYETSGAAPEETLRYARALRADELYLPAEEALIAALRIAPGMPELLNELGRLYIVMEDWARAEHVEETIRGLDIDDAERLADGLLATRLAAQGRMDDTIAFLEGLAEEAPETDLGVEISLVRSLLASGEEDRALARIRDAAGEAPDSAALAMLQGIVEAAVGEAEAAEESLRRALDMEPRLERAWIELIRALHAQGRVEDAEAALAAGLEALPEGVNLLWAQASFFERAGKFEEAIAVYERLYDRVPDNPFVANNLASMLSTYREDEESLERAYSIARRLRGSDIPQFRDTYGWIAFRRGDLSEAGPYLESAAQALGEDALVQFHYGMFLAADGQIQAAIDQLDHALEIAGPEDPRPQFETARAEIERLQALAEESGEQTQ